MSKEEEYRGNAAELVGLAERAATSADKARLLGVAEAWLDLAERIRRVASRFRGRHAEADQPEQRQD
jgi:hypothetical protein